MRATKEPYLVGKVLGVCMPVEIAATAAAPKDTPKAKQTNGVSDVSAASASPLLLWLESFSADAQKTPTAPTARRSPASLRNEAFESLLNSLDANDSRCLAPPAKIQAKDSKRLLQLGGIDAHATLLSFMGKEKFEQRLVTYCLLLPRHQHWEAQLQALLEHGLAPAAPLTPSADQWPLHAAARHNCLPVVLLVAKADPFARNVRHLTALDVAKNSRSWAAAAAIRRAPFKARGFHVQLVAEALARHVEDREQELHASMVAADTEDVAEALLRHLDAQELPKEQLDSHCHGKWPHRGLPVEDSVATDLVAEALAKMTAATWRLQIRAHAD
eukprot:Skav222365  [mRNA]  locus=scaffold2692:101847:109903:+ [translate_table: standard]